MKPAFAIDWPRELREHCSSQRSRTDVISDIMPWTRSSVSSAQPCAGRTSPRVTSLFSEGVINWHSAVCWPMSSSSISFASFTVADIVSLYTSHLEQQGAFLKPREVTRKTMLNLKDFLTQVHRESCRQLLTNSMHIQCSPMVCSGFRFLPVMTWNIRAPHEPSFESSASVKVQFPTCHNKLVVTETPNAGILEHKGISGLSKIGLQAEKRR